MKTTLATVEQAERDEIHAIYSHLSALKEIEYLIATAPKDVYDSYYRDLEKTDQEYQDWWVRISTKYNLPAFDGKDWEFDFRTNNIFLL